MYCVVDSRLGSDHMSVGCGGPRLMLANLYRLPKKLRENKETKKRVLSSSQVLTSIGPPGMAYMYAIEYEYYRKQMKLPSLQHGSVLFVKEY